MKIIPTPSIPSINKMKSIFHGKKEKTADTRNIVQITAFTRRLLRILGGDIYNYTALSNNQVKVGVSPIGLFVCVFYYAVYVYCTVHATLHKESILAPLYSTVINYYGEYLETFLSFILVTYSSLYLAFRKRVMLQLFEGVLAIDQCIHELGVDLDCKSIRLHLYVMTGWQFVAGSIKYLGLTIIFWFWDLETPICKIIYLMFTFNVIMLCLIKFFCLNVIIQVRYRYLNDILMSVLPSKHGKDEVRVVTVKEANADERKYIPKVSAVDKIRGISRIYSKVYRLRADIDAETGTLIVLLLLNSFITNILCMFYVMEATAGGLFRYYTRYCFFVYFNIQTVFFRKFMTWFIVYSCEKIYAETSKTAGIIHDIINTNISAEINEVANNFSLQLLHQQPKFTAKGLLVIDKGLLLTVTASTTTYLIILMQFANAGKIDDIAEDLNKNITSGKY